jgi:hypothetical protein
VVPMCIDGFKGNPPLHPVYSRGVVILLNRLIMIRL